jgi:signal transduction histidine kinase
MSAPPTGFKAWLKRLEERGDAWAAKRLSPEEFADATALDLQLKQHWLRWLAWYVLAIGGLTLGLVLLRAGKIDWGHAFIVANVLGVCALAFFLSAWYGYRKWTGQRARRNFANFVAALVLGAAGVVAIDLVTPGPSIYENPEKVSLLLGVILLMAMTAYAMIKAIATLRSREVAQRMALLQADAVRERLERQGVQAELKLLQAQVEPHFLFNTLANVRHLVQRGSPDALAMLDHLIHYLRTSLPEIRSESSTLGREAELARAYLEILRLRMGGALEIAIDIPADLARAPFPPLMVMTLVENAIKHGVAPQGRGHVSVSASAANGKLRVVVQDDGRGLDGTLGRGVGLANVRERLGAIFGAQARLDLEGRADGGTRATIEVPER